VIDVKYNFRYSFPSHNFFFTKKEETVPMTKAKPDQIYTKGTLYELSCDLLKTDPNQPRKYFSEVALQDLVISIEKQGILQPILFRQDDNNELFIVAGERRLQAAKEARFKTIPALMVEGNYDEIALIENILREDLTAVEFAESLGRIKDEHNYSNEQLTGLIGRAKSTVSEILSLNRLPEEIRNECRTNPDIPRKALLNLAKKKKPESMLAAYKKYKEQPLSSKKRGPKGKRKTWQDKFQNKYKELTALAASINIGPMGRNERNDLITSIGVLKTAADQLIKQIDEAPFEEKKPTEKFAPKKATKKKITDKPETKKVEKKPAITEVPKKADKKKKAASDSKKNTK
jgi:ParB family chromosome partitioning protein